MPDALLDGLLNHVSSALIVVEAVRRADQTIVDFCCVRANKPAQLLAPRLGGDLASPGASFLSLLPSLLHAPFLVPEDQPAPGNETIFDRFVRQVNEGNSLTFEINFHNDTLDGTFGIASSPLPNGLIISLTDVTEERRKQAQLQQREQLLNSLMAQSDNGTIVLKAIRQPGPDGRPGPVVDFMSLLWNDAALRISQFTGDQVRTQRLSVLRQNFHTVLLPMFTQVLETGESTWHEYVYEPDGRWMKLALARADADHLIMTTTDIHDVKLAQQRAEEQASLLSAMLETTKAIITLYEPVTDSSGQIVDFRYMFTNASNARSTGKSVAEMTGRRLFELFPGIRGTEFYANLLHTALTGEATHLLFPYFKDGVSGWFDTDFSKQGPYVLFTSLDVTELKTAELDLKRSNDYLQQFAYVASHDLQEPLRKIQSFGTMLVERYSEELSEGGVDMLIRMQRAANRMSDLVRDLLTYSRLTTQQPPFGPVNLNEVIQDILSDFDLTIRNRNAQLTVHQLPVVNGDKGQLRQLFQNLLSNALKYVKPDQVPVITVNSERLRREQLPAAIASVTDSTIQVFRTVSVADNGIGFDEQYRDRIFQMFQRLHGRSEFDGSGMGLAICKRVVDNHQGSITAHSHPGEGSVFTVYLPE